MTVTENVAIAAPGARPCLQDGEPGDTRAKGCPSASGWPADASPLELSGGQQQRVAIARALAQKPKLMLFDEPTSALDPELVCEVLNVIEELAGEGRTMLLVTHEIAFARDVADRVMFLDGGVMVERGDPFQVFTAPKEERTRRFLDRILRRCVIGFWRPVGSADSLT